MATVSNQEDKRNIVSMKPEDEIAIEGWLYKKANLAIQGYKRRWARINVKGEFIYSKHPGSPARSAVNLKTSSINFNNRRLGIVIDSENCILHLKLRLKSEYERWVNEINKLAPPDTTNFADLFKDDRANPEKQLAALESNNDFRELKISYMSPKDFLSAASKDLKSVITELDSALNSLSGNDYSSANNIVTSSREKIHLIVNNLEASIMPNVSSEIQRRDACITFMMKTLSTCKEGDALIKRAFSEASAALSVSGALDSPITYDTSHNSRELLRKSSRMGSFTETQDEEFFDALEEAYLNSKSSNNLDSTSDYDEASIKTGSEDDEYSSEEAKDNEDTSFISLEVSAKLPSKVKDQSPSIKEPPQSLGKDTYIDHRTSLPAPEVPMCNKGFYSLLKSSIGKDLSRVSMPVTFNEPLNTIQKLCQQFEYSDILDKASTTQDPLMRLCWVTAFSVSVYSACMSVAGRKPFNPLLGETYEMICPSKNFKFIGEKVTQHPAVVVCDVTGSGYHYTEQSQLRTNFWGRSLEFAQDCVINLSIPKYNEVYSWNKVNSCIRNVFSSKYTVEVYGTLKVVVLNDKGYHCELNFRESGYFKSSNNEIEGSIKDTSGRKLVQFRGCWDKYLECYEPATKGAPIMLWQAKPINPQYRHAYGFTPFAVSLNELTENMVSLLPKTDTRFRPDQSLYEKGKHEAAEAEKLRLEQKQRNLRKDMELKGQSWIPKWFTMTETTHKGLTKKLWTFNSQYWDKRGSFTNDTPDLWFISHTYKHGKDIMELTAK